MYSVTKLASNVCRTDCGNCYCKQNYDLFLFFNFRQMEANKELPGAFKTPCKPAKVKSPGRVVF